MIAVGIGYAHNHDPIRQVAEMSVQQFGAFALVILFSLGLNVWLARKYDNERSLNLDLTKQLLEHHADYQKLVERVVKFLSKIQQGRDVDIEEV